MLIVIKIRQDLFIFIAQNISPCIINHFFFLILIILKNFTHQFQRQFQMKKLRENAK